MKAGPNLQNIPIRRELGRDIRGGFVPAPGSGQFAVEHPDGFLTLWVSSKGLDDAGRELGFVENGWWDGTFYDGKVLCHSTGVVAPGRIVWRGTVPPKLAIEEPTDLGHDFYAVVLQWIRGEIDAGRGCESR